MNASLYRRAGVWYVKAHPPTWAREKRFSLDTRDKRVAQAKFEAWLQDFEKEAAGLLPALSLREAAQRPLAAFITAFLCDMESRQKAASTVKLYRGLLLRLCAQTGWTQLRDVTVSSFCEWRNESPLGPKSLNNCLNVWSRLFRWLKRQRLVLENPFEFVDPVDTRASAREYRRSGTLDEVLRLLALPLTARRTIYRLMLEAALRPGEPRKLRIGDFFLGAGVAPARPEAVASTGRDSVGLASRVAGLGLAPISAGSRRPPTASGGWPCVRIPASIAKNRKTVLQPLGPEIVAELRALFPPDAPPFALAFPGLVPKCPTFRKDLAAAGIPFLDAAGRRFDMHALRKTAGTHMVLSGAEPRVVMEFMRHSDLKLTMKTYMDAAQLRGPVAAAVARLPWHTAPVAQQEASS